MSYEREPLIERDPFFAKFEQDTLSQLASIVPPEAPQHIPSTRQLPSDNKLVSVEDAIKELKALGLL